MLGLHRLPAASLDLRISQHGDAVAQSAWQARSDTDQIRSHSELLLQKPYKDGTAYNTSPFSRVQSILGEQRVPYMRFVSDVQSMPRQDKEDLAAMASAARRPLSKAAVIVCHSEPGTHLIILQTRTERNKTCTRAKNTGKHGQTTGSNLKCDMVKAQSALLQACRQGSIHARLLP